MNDSITLAQKEKTAQLIWTSFIVMFFVIQAIIWLIALTITANDKSHAIVAGYDEKALRWDEEKAMRVASAKLGWKTELMVDRAADIRGFHVISLKLWDAETKPISDAAIELTAFHGAKAGEPQTILLKEIGEGVYAGKIHVGKNGLWRFTGFIGSGGNMFLIDERQQLNVST